MNWKTLNPFTLPSADVIAMIELEDARRQLLAAHTSLEYAKAMVAYNTQRVARLEQRTKEIV
jgi:hypothetical protein